MMESCRRTSRPALAVLAVVAVCSASASAAPRVLQVGTFHGIAGQYLTIQEAVNAAQPGDWILVGPGDYHEQGYKGEVEPAGVLITTAGIHLRGMDRNAVIVDGTQPGASPCSNVASEQAPGPNGSGRNGIPGVIEHSYAGNMSDSGFYVGACPDCNAVLSYVHAQNNAQGFSGSNAGGHLVLEHSEWDHNQAGIVPSALAAFDLPSPQDGACPSDPNESCT